MMTSTSPSKIDSIEIGEIRVDFFVDKAITPGGGTMSAKYAFLYSPEGLRMGSGNRNIWSEGTLQKLQELVKMMEADICHDVFGDSHTAGSVAQSTDDTSDSVPSL